MKTVINICFLDGCFLRWLAVNNKINRKLALSTVCILNFQKCKFIDEEKLQIGL